MTDTTDVATLVDAAARRTPGVACTYIAAPAVHHIVGALTATDVHAHVVTFPKQSIVCSIGLAPQAASRSTAAAVAAEIHAVLPDDWRAASVTVQIRRIHD